MSPRTLQRWFARHVGLPPRRYLRLLRFHKAFEQVPASATLAGHAAAHGLRRPGPYGARLPRARRRPGEAGAPRRARAVPDLARRPPEAVDEAVGPPADRRVEDELAVIVLRVPAARSIRRRTRSRRARNRRGPWPDRSGAAPRPRRGCRRPDWRHGRSPRSSRRASATGRRCAGTRRDRCAGSGSGRSANKRRDN